MKTLQERTQKTALGYLRISDKKQIKGESIANQKGTIEAYAKSKDIRIIEWFTDEAKSGKNADREALQELLKMAARMKGSIDFVIVYKMNRASRDLSSYFTGIRGLLAPLGIQVRSATEHFEDTPDGHFMEAMHILVSQLDNENKRQTVMDNMARIAKQGFWQHHPPRGYDRHEMKNDENKSRPSIKPNHEAPKVKKLLMRWNRGDMTESQLMRYAVSIGLLGLKTGKPMTQQTLHKIITNPIYAGYICEKYTDFKRVKGQHEGLITPEVFEQNQLVLKMNNKDYLLGLKHRKTNELYPLRRFVRCVRCDRHMTACQPKNSPRYFCHRPSCPKSGSIMARTLHEQFEQVLKTITPTKGTVRLLKEILKRLVNKELGSINHDIRQLRASLDANDAYKQKILDKFINDKISEADKELAMRKAGTDRQSLQAELAGLQQRQMISEDSIESALNFMLDISTHWGSAPLEIKQAYQELVFPEGFVYDIKSQKIITPEISPLYTLANTKKDAEASGFNGLVTPRRIELRLPD